jgi:uncharacterized damage-inducible protein DinB
MLAIQRLIKQLDTVYRGNPWYGLSVKKSLKTVLPQQCTLRFASHNIAEYVDHMLSWKQFVIKRLEGDEEFRIELNSSDDWKYIDHLSIEEWKQLLDDMDTAHEKLIQVLQHKTDALLSEPVKGSQYEYDYEMMLNGILQHDIYHLGQINQLKSYLKRNDPS